MCMFMCVYGEICILKSQAPLCLWCSRWILGCLQFLGLVVAVVSSVPHLFETPLVNQTSLKWFSLYSAPPECAGFWCRWQTYLMAERLQSCRARHILIACEPETRSVDAECLGGKCLRKWHQVSSSFPCGSQGNNISFVPGQDGLETKQFFFFGGK